MVLLSAWGLVLPNEKATKISIITFFFYFFLFLLHIAAKMLRQIIVFALPLDAKWDSVSGWPMAKD